VSDGALRAAFSGPDHANDRLEHWDNILRYESAIAQEETKITTVLVQIVQKND
jgi:hypothetical protein